MARNTEINIFYRRKQREQRRHLEIRIDRSRQDLGCRILAEEPDVDSFLFRAKLGPGLGLVNPCPSVQSVVSTAFAGFNLCFLFSLL
jgi:hypothetical protein